MWLKDVDNWNTNVAISCSNPKISSSGMQTRVSSSPPRARKDTTDFFTLRRALRALARLITPAATTAAALGALTFGVALGALEEVAICVRVADLLGACTRFLIEAQTRCPA